MYHDENTHCELIAGKCCSTPHQSSDGKLALKESRQWFIGDKTAETSELEEVVESQQTPVHSLFAVAGLAINCSPVWWALTIHQNWSLNERFG